MFCSTSYSSLGVWIFCRLPLSAVPYSKYGYCTLRRCTVSRHAPHPNNWHWVYCYRCKAGKGLKLRAQIQRGEVLNLDTRTTLEIPPSLHGKLQDKGDENMFAFWLAARRPSYTQGLGNLRPRRFIISLSKVAFRVSGWEPPFRCWEPDDPTRGRTMLYTWRTLGRNHVCTE